MWFGIKGCAVASGTVVSCMMGTLFTIGAPYSSRAQHRTWHTCKLIVFITAKASVACMMRRGCSAGVLVRKAIF